MKKRLAILLYSDAKREYFASDELYMTEEEVYPRSKIIKPHIEKLGYKVILLPGNPESVDKIKKLKPHVVFNLVDSLYGREDLVGVIPALLESAGVPYTGAGISGLTLNTNKYLTKAILKQSGLPTPNFQLFETPRDKLEKGMRFPLIVKLNQFHGSVEISQQAVVENEKALRERVKFLMDKYKQEIMVEEYISGKEITALMIDGKKQIILAEKRIFLKKEKYNLYGFEEAWSDEEFYDVEKYPLSPTIVEDIKKVFKVLQMRDYARIEIMIDENGGHYFIDPNVNPAFGPIEAGEAFGYLINLYGIQFVDVAKQIIDNVRLRFK